MTHTGPMSDSEGDFDPWKIDEHNHAYYGRSKNCDGTIEYRCWESSCGGYEDYQFRCKKCGATWWSEGADA